MTEKKPAEMIIVNSEDIFRILCNSVRSVLSSATNSAVTFSPMIQEVEKTCLKPDIGCFVLFGGDFTGLVVMNFTKEAAMDIYRGYLISMGMPEAEIASNYTADEVSSSLGELMNQCIGRFRLDLERETSIYISQNQPKMLVITEAVYIAIDAAIEKPQLRKISFRTANSNRFYLEASMGKIKFHSLFPFKKAKEFDVDDIMAAGQGQ